MGSEMCIRDRPKGSAAESRRGTRHMDKSYDHTVLKRGRVGPDRPAIKVRRISTHRRIVLSES